MPAVIIQVETDVGVVAAGYNFGFRHAINAALFLDHPYEGVVVGCGAISFPQILGGNTFLSFGVYRRQGAAYQIDRGHGKRHVVQSAFLYDLGSVAVAEG